MTWNLFIDDERYPYNVTWADPEFYKVFPWVIARDITEVKNLVAAHGSLPNIISFDHDLGDHTPSGYDIAKWLVEMDFGNNLSFPTDFKFFVHSMNPIGKENIHRYLQNYFKATRE